MSAAEIIEQIKSLPAVDQQKVVEFVRSLKSATTNNLEQISYASVDRVKSIGDSIFEENPTLFRKLAE